MRGRIGLCVGVEGGENVREEELGLKLNLRKKLGGEEAVNASGFVVVSSLLSGGGGGGVAKFCEVEGKEEEGGAVASIFNC